MTVYVKRNANLRRLRSRRYKAARKADPKGVARFERGVEASRDRWFERQAGRRAAC